MLRVIPFFFATILGLFGSFGFASDDSVSLNACASHLWRGADASSDLRHLTEPERLNRISEHDQDEVYTFFSNLADFVYGKRTLEEAITHPNSIHVPYFIMNHFVSVYSQRVQFEQFLIALQRLATIFKLDARDISPGSQLGEAVSMRDAWYHFFTNLAAGDSKDNIFLLVFAFYLEVELSNEQSHTVVFMEDIVHKAFAQAFTGFTQHLSNKLNVISQVKEIVNSLSKTLQVIAKSTTSDKNLKPVEESVFVGESEFYNALQKVDLKALSTPIVKYELVLLPLMDHLGNLIAEHPEWGEEIVRRAERTIRQEKPVNNENFIITLAKLPPVAQGSTQFVQGIFSFSKYQGLWSFAAIFKNLPHPDQLPENVKKAIRDLFESMERPQNLP